jgi:hypothetical protein
VLLYSDDLEGITATLATDPTELLKAADRGAAIVNLMLRGLFGSEDPRDVDAKLAEQTVNIADGRKKKAAGAPFLIVSVELNVDPDFGGAHVDQPDYSVYWDAIDKDLVRETARRSAEGVVAAAIVASTAHLRYDRIGESVYLVGDDSRVTYSISAKLNAPSLSVRSLALELPTLMRTYVPAALRRKDQSDLRTVLVLLRASVDGQTEHLRAFISAWSALEIFTNKVFKEYETLWFEELAKGIAPRHQLLARVRDVMQGKYRLRDEFAVISSVLLQVDAEADIADFVDLKTRRDELSHGGILDEDALPVHRTVALARKYLRLHLGRVEAKGASS